jgi:predicted nucleic acid-binding protein
VAHVIVVDASVLIAHFNGRDALHERAEAVLLNSADRPLAASAITIAEILVGPARIGRLDAARAALDRLGVAEIPVPEGAADRLAALRADTGLKLPECCVLLAAQDARAQTVLTFDERLEKRALELGFASS